VEFRVGSVLLEAGGQICELPNDFVWVFAGGTSPADFLKAAGVAFGNSEPAKPVMTQVSEC